MAEYRFEASEFKNEDIANQFHDFQVTLGAIREIRATRNIPFSEAIPFSTGCDQATANTLFTMANSFGHLANAIPTAGGPDVVPAHNDMSCVVYGVRGPIQVNVDVSRFIDVAAERKRLEKERDNITKFLKSIDAKLGNAAFVDKAPADVVQLQRTKRGELASQLESVETALAKLK